MGDVVVYTKTKRTSEWSAAEVAMARERGSTVVVFREKGAYLGDFVPRGEQVWFERHNLAEALEKLVTSVQYQLNQRKIFHVVGRKANIMISVSLNFVEHSGGDFQPSGILSLLLFPSSSRARLT